MVNENKSEFKNGFVFYLWISKLWRSAHNKLTNAARRHTYSQVGASEYEATDLSPHTQASCHRCNIPFLGQIRYIKFVFLVSCTCFAFSLFSVQLATRPDEPVVTESVIQEALKNISHDDRDKKVYKKTRWLPKDFKYILLWTQEDYAPLSFLGKEQKMFLKNNCSVTKCYVTADRKLFGGDLTKFDAIAFNGRNMMASDLPTARSHHQKYIFFNMESADNYPVCGAQFDGFFNWTATYRLDSNIPFTYIMIRDKKGEVVGPKRKMRWKEDVVRTVEDDFVDRNRIQNKTKAAAWFVSNCKTKSGRQGYVKALKNALKPYGFTVDVYGLCGTLQCPRHNPSHCNYLLKNDYYFYMAMENSFDDDYVTEKLLLALHNDVVPIVYGGANYSRFLPPGSYIDARKQPVIKLAAMMNKLMHSPEEYNKYFRWKHHYTYSNPSTSENVCAVCEALHDKTMLQKTTIYDDFRHWWLPNYEKRCPRKKH